MLSVFLVRYSMGYQILGHENRSLRSFLFCVCFLFYLLFLYFNHDHGIEMIRLLPLLRPQFSLLWFWLFLCSLPPSFLVMAKVASAPVRRK
ncbi:hypothetical protein BGZ63DRAFT_113377 [Mariannaea sp. PMI_226]|nr:hypothetical protein BGZ63DRAFT_113377 [Mariannaea sp. PMI_226]